MPTYRGRVTKAHILNGLKQSYLTCPVALALHQATKSWARVFGDDFNFLCNNYHTSYPLPVKVRKWIHRFESGEVVKTFTFTIKVPRYALHRR